MLRQLFRRPVERDTIAPLYRLIVGQARRPEWYREGGVPDTVDGRFDMVASVLALVLLRFENEGPDTRAAQALLTETFVDDMDGTLRQMGIGDLMVGKHVGRMMGALGGRLATYRAALDGDGDLDEAVRRNIFRDEAAAPAKVAYVTNAFKALWNVILGTNYPILLDGQLRT